MEGYLWCRPIFRPRDDGLRTLQIVNAGSWPARVRSDDGSIDCGTGPDLVPHLTCSATYRTGYRVELSATPGMVGGWDVTWGGDCSAGPTVFMDASRTCTVKLVAR